jgi:luciferase family oxidoreductase group 1
MLGFPFAFAHHFSPANTIPALELYRSRFRPSATLAQPYAMVAAAVTCAETDERARWLAAPGALSFLRLRSGHPSTLPTPEEADGYAYTDAERAFVDERQRSQIVGDPDTVRAGLEQLLADTDADELMITTTTHDPADRLRSFALVAELAGRSRGAALVD